MSISEKELMSKRAIQEEAKMRLSLRSIVKKSASPDNNQPSRMPLAVNVPQFEDAGKPHPNQQQNERSRQSVREDQNGNAMTTAQTSSSLSNGEVKGQTTTSNNSQPKSCLKKKPSQSQTTNGFNNNHEDAPANRSRKSMAKIECCLIG